MKEYKRLTKYNEYSHNAEVYAYSVDKDVYFDGVDIVCNENSNLAQETIDRLAELEDKIENGTIVELPCKVGDIVYEAIQGMPIQEWVIESIGWGRIYGKNYVMWAERKKDLAHWKFWKEDFGKTVFLTKAEAEKNLEK